MAVAIRYYFNAEPSKPYDGWLDERDQADALTRVHGGGFVRVYRSSPDRPLGDTDKRYPMVVRMSELCCIEFQETY